MTYKLIKLFIVLFALGGHICSSETVVEKVEPFVTPFGKILFHTHCMVKARAAGGDFWMSAKKQQVNCAWCQYKKDLPLEERAKAWRKFMKTETFKQRKRHRVSWH